MIFWEKQLLGYSTPKILQHTVFFVVDRTGKERRQRRLSLSLSLSAETERERERDTEKTSVSGLCPVQRVCVRAVSSVSAAFVLSHHRSG